MFVGREFEQHLLRDFQKRKTAGLIVCRGRRRIGKSTLIQQFGRGKRFVELWGLAPRPNISNADQLKHFGELMGTAFGLPALRFENWNEALSTLAGLTSKGRVIILLDEISWMASKDKDFAGKLKGIWDTKFKKNDKLMLILCGSVTSWIDDNILNDKGFMGRVSLTITLDELSLSAANLFWKGNKLISAAEKLKILCVTGGVPRYLEEIRIDQTAEQNIKRLCFSPTGLLFSEFDKIFKDIFQRRSRSFKEIVQTLASGAKQPQQLCDTLGRKPTGSFSGMLAQLTRSGFVTRDFVWRPATGRRTAKSVYRLKDSYLRFYLKYIEPEKDKIEKGLYRNIDLETLPHWQTIMGLSLESLVINNLASVIQKLDIAPSSIISASPYLQTKTGRQQACQIDLLIHTTHTLYVCEIRFRKQIGGSTIEEVASKIKRLKGIKALSVRPVLIYQGELATSIEQSGFFSHLLPIEQLLIY
ncbi:MAG: ATPase [Myxococcota bacterium]|nr:ATPase [Myxococcota bacterium]